MNYISLFFLASFVVVSSLQALRTKRVEVVRVEHDDRVRYDDEETLGEKATRAKNRIARKVERVKNNVEDTAADAWDKTKRKAKNAKEVVKDKAEGTWGVIEEKAAEAWDATKEAAQTVAQKAEVLRNRTQANYEKAKLERDAKNRVIDAEREVRYRVDDAVDTIKDKTESAKYKARELKRRASDAAQDEEVKQVKRDAKRVAADTKKLARDGKHAIEHEVTK